MCRGDGDKPTLLIDEDGNRVTPPRGASDAYLAPYHIERGKIYARERFGESDYVDEERIVRSIELTRFPVPDRRRSSPIPSRKPALVRAADLIGQLADPFYHRKINALFYEFQEIGLAEKMNYRGPADVVEKYPEFFWELRPALTLNRPCAIWS